MLDTYAEVEIWSHRWPDGYHEHLNNETLPEIKILIPPDDIIYGSLGMDLQAHEKLLLRYSLVSARAIPANHSSTDLDDTRSLRKWIDADPDAHWRLLLESQPLEEVVDAATSESTLANVSDGIEFLENYDNEDVTLEIKILSSRATQEVEILEGICDAENPPASAVFLVWLGDDRVLFYRRDLEAALPSLRWLIENRYSSEVPPVIAGNHYGTQDAVYFKISNSAAFRRTWGRKLKVLARTLAGAQTGGRYLTAALARDLAELANGVFSAVDLRGSYTDSRQPKIEVVAADLYELIHTSSRTNEKRKTLTVPVQVHSAEATAFLFRDGGYNLQKAEMLLEGAVTGLGKRRLLWLGNQSIPHRLRVDIRPPALGGDSGQYMAAVRAALSAPRMGTLLADDGYVSGDSVIGKFLEYCRMNSLVCFNESETIGPSVAHAMTLHAAAAAIKDGTPGAMVLDLFSGSGVANRLLSMHSHSVISVDLYVAAGAVQVAPDGGDGLWLQTDARAVLKHSSPLIEQKFDVIGLDPPHAELLDLLFGAAEQPSLVQLCAERSDWIVMYQGHTTQRGRLALVRAGLVQAGWPNVLVLQVEEELIVLAATKNIDNERFLKLASHVMSDIRNFALRHIGEVNVSEVK
ncbi:hypothetical protein AB0M83_19110 [Amycolatopsis sp. NPDC051106]|uniref:hypothetical protein n=1 Tax=unclassified Amycolatopsis TaxID=2618356 RepID=UPI003416CD33